MSNNGKMTSYLTLSRGIQNNKSQKRARNNSAPEPNNEAKEEKSQKFKYCPCLTLMFLIFNKYLLTILLKLELFSVIIAGKLPILSCPSLHFAP